MLGHSPASEHGIVQISNDLVSLRQEFQEHGVAYIENFLTHEIFLDLKRETEVCMPELRPETLASVAKGRLGMHLSPGNVIARILCGHDVCEYLRKLTASTLAASDFPVEIRRYPLHSSMGWHCDEALYEIPQIEAVFTIENTSDSETQWERQGGAIVSRSMQPNSLLLIKAEGPKHCVTPVTRGDRVIAKICYTLSRQKLPSWYANLAAYHPAASR